MKDCGFILVLFIKSNIYKLYEKQMLINYDTPESAKDLYSF